MHVINCISQQTLLIITTIYFIVDIICCLLNIFVTNINHYKVFKIIYIVIFSPFILISTKQCSFKLYRLKYHSVYNIVKV